MIWTKTIKLTRAQFETLRIQVGQKIPLTGDAGQVSLQLKEFKPGAFGIAKLSYSYVEGAPAKEDLPATPGELTVNLDNCPLLEHGPVKHALDAFFVAPTSEASSEA